MDPAAIGTTIIGLNEARREDSLDGHVVERQERPRRHPGRARRRFADTFRRAAERIAPSPAPAT